MNNVASEVKVFRKHAYLNKIYLPNGKLNVPYLIKNADILFEAKDYLLARKIYRTILQSGEYTATVLHRIGKCYEAEGKYDEAYSKYEESISYHPSPESYERLAAILMRRNRRNQSEECLERARNLRDMNNPRKRLA
jgi:tetratricopeptide (TPR) repeat protein